MKTFTSGIIVFVSLLMLNTAMAQEKVKAAPVIRDPNTCFKMELGVRMMPGFSTFKIVTGNGAAADGVESHGYGFAAIAAVNITPYMGGEMDFIYNTFSKKYEDGNLKREVNLRYLNIPLLFSLSTNKSIPVSFNVVAGPQFGFNAGSTTSVSNVIGNDSIKGILSVKQTDIAIAYGAGLNFSFSKSQRLHVCIGFRGTYGFINIGDTEKALDTGTFYILNNSNLKTYSGYAGLAFAF